MRQTMLAVFSILLSATPVPAQTPSPLDVPIAHLSIPTHLPPCGLKVAIGNVAKQSGVLVGFEQTSNCFYAFPKLDADVTDLSGMTVRSALDALVAKVPDYRWSEMNGIAVVRPASSWNDSANVLNSRVRPFALDNMPITPTLLSLLKLDRAKVTKVSWDWEKQAVSMVFSGGTMVEALNALIKAHGGMMWNAGVKVEHFTPDATYELPYFELTVGSFSTGGGVSMGTPLRLLVEAR